MSCQYNCPVYTPIPEDEACLGNPYYCDFSDYITSKPYPFDSFAETTSASTFIAAIYRPAPTLAIAPATNSRGGLTGGLIRTLLVRYSVPGAETISNSRLTGGSLRTLRKAVTIATDNAQSNAQVLGGAIRSLLLKLGPHISEVTSSAAILSAYPSQISNPNILSELIIPTTPNISIITDKQSLNVWQTVGSIASTNIQTYNGNNTIYSTGGTNILRLTSNYERLRSVQGEYSLTISFFPLGNNPFVLFESLWGGYSGIKISKAANATQLNIDLGNNTAASYFPFSTISPPNSLLIGQWNELKIVRSNTYFKIQLNNVIFYSSNNTNVGKLFMSSFYYLFNNAQQNSGFQGYIGEFRFLKDVVEVLNGTPLPEYNPENSTYLTALKALNPSAYYPMNEDSGNIVYDRATPTGDYNGNILNPSNVTYSGPALRRGAKSSLGFNVATAGTAQCQVIESQGQTLFKELAAAGKSCTILFWCRPTTITSYNWFYGYSTSPFHGSANYRMLSYYDGNSYNVIQAETPDNVNAVGSTSIMAAYLNNINFIAWKRDLTANKYYIFVNGSWNEVPATTANPNTAAASFNFPAFYDWGYYGMRGYMSDMAIFERALSHAEIQDLYQKGQF